LRRRRSTIGAIRKLDRTFSRQSFARSAKNLSGDVIEGRAPTVATQPDLRFTSRSSSEELACEISEQLADRQAIEITVGQTATIMQRAFVGMVASGSATLEAAFFGMPFVLITRLPGRLTWQHVSS